VWWPDLKSSSNPPGSPVMGSILDVDLSAQDHPACPPPIILAPIELPWVHDVDPILHLESPCCTNFNPGICDPNDRKDD
jgi:hypothetical protein